MTSGTTSTACIELGGRHHVEVPISRRPETVSPRDRETLRLLTDHIIDRVTDDHARNTIRHGGTWWIVDVTWNDGEIFSSGDPVLADAHPLASTRR